MELIAKLVAVAGGTVLGYYTKFCRLLFLRGKRKNNGRFVSIERRSWLSDLPFTSQLLHSVQASKWNNRRNEVPPVNWKGVLNMKDPIALATYPLLLWELKPATIIEFGSFNGGSAYWLADTLKIQETQGRVYSFDIDLKDVEVEHDWVEFRQADTTRLDSLDPEWLSTLPHPWLVIEDAHQNIYNLLGLLSGMMEVGDYLVVEDTFWTPKYREFKRFVLDQAGDFLVDTRYTDMFGYNVTWNPNSYLKKVR